MPHLISDLMLLILQLLEEEKFKETAHKLEQESGVFFNMEYFKEKALAGEWDEAEKYFSSYSEVEANEQSITTFFEIRKHKYYEALDKKNKERAADILDKDLKPLLKYSEELYKKFAQLITLDDFREYEELSNFGDMEPARTTAVGVIEKLIENNPLLRDKLVFPTLPKGRLRTLINQSLNWQHEGCKNPKPKPEVKTLFKDHICSPPSGTREATPILHVGAAAKPPRSPTVTKSHAHEQMPLAPGPAIANALPRWMLNTNPSVFTSPCISGSSSTSASNKEIAQPCPCRVVYIPDSIDHINKVVRVLYTNSGDGLLALGSKGIQKLWKWKRDEQNLSGKAGASVVPQHWKPESGLLMTNDVPDNSEQAVPCIVVSKNDSYVMSAFGGRISIFNMKNFKVLADFMQPPPASTFLEFFPQDNNIVAIGMEDSTIVIYNAKLDEVISKLKGHQKCITGLTFSSNLKVLVSSGADAQICFWSIDSWEKKKSLSIQMPTGMEPAGDTRVQFHSNQEHLLVCHETQIAVYDASKMELLQRVPVQENALLGSLTWAVYSCNSQLVYATFTSGCIGLFDADSLRLRRRISPSTYISQVLSSSRQSPYPIVVAAHPQEPNQFAVGISDGTIKVIEPLGS